MSEKLLREFVRLSLTETPLARVPTQLLDPDEDGKAAGDADDCGCGDKDDELDEFSAVGAGAIAGYTGPMGINPDRLGRKKNKTGTKKRKKK